MTRFLSSAQDDRLFALFFLAISTGLRRGELLGLKWGDVDFDRGILVVRRTVQRTVNGLIVKEQPKTDNSRRLVNISPATVDVLRQHQKRQAEEMLKFGLRDIEFIFTNTVGNLMEPRKVNHIFDRIIGKAGIPKIRFHDLRHTHATMLLKQGIHPKIVSERLGHSSIGITLDIYSHVIPSMQREAAVAIDQVLQKDRNTLSR
ncbi:site-specific integrase [Polycladomyces abyssicola]|uniref:site-specific integrase n=1 Tax=Polycladomyces abyssicola TaxID=1125966 RepID=UPI001BB2D373|nr:site-specific integrase [Polycladomyces abyssicola]